MQIVFALIAHSEPALVTRLINTLLRSGQRVAVHYDGKRPSTEFGLIQDSFRSNTKVCFAKRIPVEWADWSVVRATLNCLAAIEEAAWEPDYVYLLSGSDYPIRPWRDLLSFLERNKGDEFIESVASDTTKWVKSGPQEERYQYHWITNWRGSPVLTDNILAIQKRLKLKRRFVRNYAPYLGSQWWVLTWQTLKGILVLARDEEIRSFFKTTLVPDELFFQTLVRTVVPDHRVIGCTLTLYQFTDYGYPVVYHSDHIDYLVRQRFFMARKLSSCDGTLRDRLDDFWDGKSQSPPFRDEDVGIRTSEYEDWRLAHRVGAPNTPLIAAPEQGWATASRRTSKEALCIVGTSVAELRYFHHLISRRPDVIMHGQLFHPKKIEFVNGEKDFAGYSGNDIQLRDNARAEFFLDILRANPDHISGFILRSGQAGPFAETLMQRANVKTVFVRGDPIVSFIESLYGLFETPSPGSIDDQALSPGAVANHFRRFLREYRHHIKVMERQFRTARDSKPRNWAMRLDVFDETTKWLPKLSECIGFDFNAGTSYDKSAPSEYSGIRQQEVHAIESLLIEGGIDPAVFEVMRKQAEGSDLLLSFV